MSLVELSRPPGVSSSITSAIAAASRAWAIAFWMWSETRRVDAARDGRDVDLAAARASPQTARQPPAPAPRAGRASSAAQLRHALQDAGGDLALARGGDVDDRTARGPTIQTSLSAAPMPASARETSLATIRSQPLRASFARLPARPASLPRIRPRCGCPCAPNLGQDVRVAHELERERVAALLDLLLGRRRDAVVRDRCSLDRDRGALERAEHGVAHLRGRAHVDARDTGWCR